MANNSPRTSTQTPNVLVHPTAGNAPVVVARSAGRPRRLPSNVTSLSKVRSKKVVAQAVPSDYSGQSYRDRRDAALEAVMQGPDAALFEECELLYQALMTISNRVCGLKNNLLYRVDPELEQLGQVVVGGGQ